MQSAFPGGGKNMPMAPSDAMPFVAHSLPYGWASAISTTLLGHELLPLVVQFSFQWRAAQGYIHVHLTHEVLFAFWPHTINCFVLSFTVINIV
jgi:hypothetical protein